MEFLRHSTRSSISRWISGSWRRRENKAALPALHGAGVSIEKLRELEIEEARALQRAMVPAEPLQLEFVEVANGFRPAREVGGDFLDYFLLPDRKLGLYLGDVVGKGLPAALFAALAVGTLRGIPKTGMQPGDVLGLLNERLRDRAVPGRYCAAVYAVFDPATRMLHYANAGLPRPLHIAEGGCRELDVGGVPCGMLPAMQYEPESMRLEPGHALLFFTDGLIEARNPDGEEFGAERLREACAQNGHVSAEALLRHVFNAVDCFVGDSPQFDDIAATALKLTR